MPRYLFGDSRLSSSIQLDLQRANGVGRLDLAIQEGTGPEIAEPVTWLKAYVRTSKRAYLRLGKQGSAYLLHFPGLGTFRFHPAPAEIEWFPARSDVPAQSVAHALLDQVIPRALSMLGRMVLHGAALVVNGQAVLFLGESGWGKSTLAAFLAAREYPILTDDCVLLREDKGRVTCTGSYPGVRLWPDSLTALELDPDSLPLVAHYHDKRRVVPEVDPANGELVRWPVRSVYVLSNPAEDPPGNVPCAIEPLTVREAVMALVSCAFRLDFTDRGRNAREFESLTDLASRLPMFRLTYPRRFELLPVVREAVLAHVQTTQSSP